MSITASNLGQTVLALREEFDRSFAQAPRTKTESVENFLAVRVGADAYAIRVAEIGGIHADRRIMPLPTSIPELLGVTGFRGKIAPVYDLAALLGYARQSSPRWLILVRYHEPLALAFDVFESHFSVFPERIISSGSESISNKTARPPYLGDAVRTDDGVRPIIQLQSIIKDIQRRKEIQRRENLST